MYIACFRLIHLSSSPRKHPVYRVEWDRRSDGRCGRRFQLHLRTPNPFCFHRCSVVDVVVVVDVLIQLPLALVVYSNSNDDDAHIDGVVPISLAPTTFVTLLLESSISLD